MYPINLLIKPSSGTCNFACKYCFYYDVIENREIKSYGFMELDTLKIIVKKTLSSCVGYCSFIFQGGEPTLIGLDFYKKLIEYVQQFNVKNIKVNYAIQTNGSMLTDEWAKFFGKNKFLVGISLDGIKDTHDIFRLDSKLNGTYDDTIKKIELLKKYNVEHNILTVITAQVAKNIKRIYNFYKKNDYIYQQYIPCLDPIGSTSISEYSLTPDIYGKFLCDLFDLWYDDIKNDNFIYNRYFENIVGMIKGYSPEACGMFGHCAIQNVVEADGSVYPCDFYVADGYSIGNLVIDEFKDIQQNKIAQKFLENSFKVESECNVCKWKNICRGGCRRNRDNNIDGNITLNYYCKSFKMFFGYSMDRMRKL